MVVDGGIEVHVALGDGHREGDLRAGRVAGGGQAGVVGGDAGLALVEVLELRRLRLWRRTVAGATGEEEQGEDDGEGALHGWGSWGMVAP